MSRIKLGLQEPTLAENWAIAMELGETPGSLAYGETAIVTESAAAAVSEPTSRQTKKVRRRKPAPKTEDLPAVAKNRRHGGNDDGAA